MNEKARDAASTRPSEDRIFLTAAEVGRQLGVRKSRVYALAASGLIPSVRLGPRKILFPRRGLEQMAQKAIERAQEQIEAHPVRRVA